MTDRWATFDCYGTLIDWDGGIRRALARVWPEEDGQRLFHRYHDGERRVQAGSDISYRQVLRETLAAIAEAEELEVPPGREDALSESLPSWRPFPEVTGALADLRDRGWRLAILSNTDPDLLSTSLKTIGVEVDVRITAAEAHSYKPAFGHWDTFFRTTTADRERHVHVGGLAVSRRRAVRAARPAVRVDQPPRRVERPAARRRAVRSRQACLPRWTPWFPGSIPPMDLLGPPEAFDAKKVEDGVRLILEGIGEDPDRGGLRETPARVARMYEEIFAGIGKDASQLVTVVEGADHDEMIMVRDIPLQSFCEHHLIPFAGRAHVAYIPNKAQQITGLSKIARVVDLLAKKPQVQERLTTEIAEAIDRALSPRGVFVVIEAEHFCMTMRGIKKPGSVTVTSTVRGLFRSDARTRQEAMDHIGMR